MIKAIQALATALLIGWAVLAEMAPAADSAPPNSAESCLDCHQKHNDEVVPLYLRSIHWRAAIMCDSCHGGDGRSADKQKAHGSDFVARPIGNQALEACGKCHSQQLALLRASRHFPEYRSQPRLDCTVCHSAHSVGAPNRNFSFAYTCSGCHGLEYLPALPPEFQKMLALADELKKIEGTKEILERKHRISRLISEIVHSTDLQGGLKKIPHILQLGSMLKQAVDQKKQ
jgi:nitrate/TMAO reductase-like tetraheme cytochrome c subunit